MWAGGVNPGNLDRLRLEVESEVPTEAFGDHQDLFGSHNLRGCLPVLPFGLPSGPWKAEVASLAGSGQLGTVSHQHLARTGPGSCGSCLLFVYAALNSVQPQGVICTWPASPGLERYREEGDSRRNEGRQLGRPSGGGHHGKAFRGAVREEGVGSGRRGLSQDQGREMASSSLPPHSSWNFFVPLVIEE